MDNALLKKVLLTPYKTNNYVIKMQSEGLTHDDSLLQMPFRGNCLNWVVGHMIASRDHILRRLGQEPVWTKDVGKRYDFGSEPITSAEDTTVIHYDDMHSLLATQLERLEAGIDALTDEQLNEANERGQTLAEYIGFMGFHDSYHSGQTEYLRQLAGTDDQII